MLEPIIIRIPTEKEREESQLLAWWMGEGASKVAPKERAIERCMTYTPTETDFSPSERELLARAQGVADSLGEQYEAAREVAREKGRLYFADENEQTRAAYIQALGAAYKAEALLSGADEIEADLSEELTRRYARYEGQLLTVAQRLRASASVLTPMPEGENI